MSPFDLLKLSLNEKGVFVLVKSGNDNHLKETEMIGNLIAFDEHLNIMMADCTETVYN